ncbi:alpha/beta fold hydrolase [Maribacter sp. MJ134]|uniref:YheT family hydrolase n=1 Tax=Maribacter sp. MJ134 TaxID=2496865 RepID=UPI000F82A552|nr:alpha/beta fold hydrolase [Maribacter sp. MJ134]AZQ59999.1 alpha/beta fold hydrolase [Maribacter sp. MJ134]
MPLVSSNYDPPLFFKNGHLATVYSGLLRKVTGIPQERQRISLPDGDFLDLDWSLPTAPTTKVVVVLHGLEGNAQRAYIQGSAKALVTAGYAVCAVNFRGCSGEPNTLYRSYHSGATEDLIAVVDHILHTKKYTQIYLKGFSLGGNLLLKYLGEGTSVPAEIKGAVAVSVPCQLADSLSQLLSFKNLAYAARFKKNLVEKLKAKQQLFPEKISDADIKNVVTLKDFDDIYTSKAHGFTDAMDYYTQCSCLQFLKNVQVPSLLINAQNDSFLGEECYPIEEAKYSSAVFLEIPKYGGHVGFHGTSNFTYTERRAVEFFSKLG